MSAIEQIAPRSDESPSAVVPTLNSQAKFTQLASSSQNTSPNITASDSAATSVDAADGDQLIAGLSPGDRMTKTRGQQAVILSQQGYAPIGSFGMHLDPVYYGVSVEKIWERQGSWRWKPALERCRASKSRRHDYCRYEPRGIASRARRDPERPGGY